MKEVRHREVAQLAQGHTAERPCQDSHQYLMMPRADLLFTTSKQPPHQNVLVNSPRVQQGDNTEPRDLLLHVRQRTVEITASATRSDFELWVSY